MSAQTIGKANTSSKRTADSGERAYNIIRKLLVEFRLRPGERVNEVQLSRTLSLSRTPIREALNRLASDGFVEFSPNRGFHVRALSTDGLIDLYELRSIIECAAFQMLCTRATDEELRAFEDFWASIRVDYKDRQPDEILALDEEFHMRIAELSGNLEIPRQLTAINARIRFIRRIQIEHVSHDQAQVLMHDEILDAAMKRDCDAGEKALKSHIQLTVSATQQALKDALFKAYEATTGVSQRGLIKAQ